MSIFESELHVVAGDTAKGSHDIREDLNQLIPYAKTIAQSLSLKVGRPDLELDLRQEALIGALKAARNFNPEVGVCFPTFAYPRMQGAAKRYALKATTPVHQPERVQISTESGIQGVPLEALDSGDWAMHENFHATTDYARTNELEALSAFVHTLPTSDREILVSYFGLEGVEPMPLSKMSNALDRTEGEIMKSLERSYSSLRASLDHQDCEVCP